MSFAYISRPKYCIYDMFDHLLVNIINWITGLNKFVSIIALYQILIIP